MKFVVIGVRDRVSNNFEGIALSTNEFTAKRDFAYNVNNSGELLFKAKDLELCCIGNFDSETGVVDPVIPANLICRGDEIIVEK